MPCWNRKHHPPQSIRRRNRRDRRHRDMGATAQLRLRERTESSSRMRTLQSGDPCPECREGKVYRQKEPATLIRIVGQAPLKATVFEMERLRCNACGEVFTASEPPAAGPEKFDSHRRGDDRAVEVWYWNALQPDGAAGGTTGDAAPGAQRSGS